MPDNQQRYSRGRSPVKRGANPPNPFHGFGFGNNDNVLEAASSFEKKSDDAITTQRRSRHGHEHVPVTTARAVFTSTLMRAEFQKQLRSLSSRHGTSILDIADAKVLLYRNVMPI